ncbi:asparagine synthase-related protein [Butyrivibrio sp. VCD2006]|uniref:asparagine synthase-related protein n=1 Tax=Butyrivibrio sp. VCD2006 TaxID=1280664 RepID=UPI0004288DBC|nr:asparagine synthase-related protein [Butyrivibrio sp. VCD2006]
MSGIWGYIKLNSNDEALASRISEVKGQMMEPYNECAIDRFEEKEFDNGFFACGIQYFNVRSRNEVLPFYDEKEGTVFTADVVLNGRQKLVDELQKSGFSEVSMETPDGELAFKSWKKWGLDFTSHLLGLFAIAIYEKKNNEFYLFTDHTGCRCVDYSICGDELYFSTLSRPIFNAMPAEYKGYDEQFITGCEASFSAYMYAFPDRTPFNNIFHTVRGCYIKAVPVGSKWSYSSKTYFDPSCDFKTSKSWPKDPYDPIYRETFRNVFFECVRDAIDTDGGIAATISSGLDSSSVATVAAKLMQGENKTLYGYTSVPLKEYEYKNPGFDMPDGRVNAW